MTKDFVEARFDREIRKSLYWNVGGSWDRNLDAGVLSRYIAFAGVGNLWIERDELKFSTAYGGSYTNREEEEPDPEKEDRFSGLRLDSELTVKFGKSTSYDLDFTGNMSLSDTSDYTLDMTNSVKVAMAKHLALKVSLQWVYSGEPALEDVDVIARVEFVDPDGIPGTGDEYYQTVSSGGTEITLGEDRVRKESLDTVFRTTLVIDF